MKKMLSTAVMALFCVGVSAQSLDVSQLKNMKPRNIGPAGTSGRVTSIDAVNSNPNIIYIGTASGGVWKSESGGVTWKPIFDKQPLLGIGSIAIQQSNPDVIWAGTGEGNPRNSQTSGAGIYKSLDAGRTWSLMGLEKTKTIHRIIVHRDNPNEVYAATMGSAWGSNPERGLYKTTDGGKTWKNILFVNDQTGCADLVVDPSNPNKMIAAMWEYDRKPWFFTSGGEGSGLYMTVDGGENWKKLNEKNGLPKSKIGRTGLAIAASNPDVIYALVESEKTALYRSTDGGFNWTKRSEKNIGNRPFYYADIFVDPQNENRIYNLYSVVSKSEDGGKTFQTLLSYGAAHPDHHALWIDPNNSDFIIDGNDGGLNISRDRGKKWRFVENLPLSQFYHINVDMETPYNVYGGMQDNGSWRGPGYLWQRGGIRNEMWDGLVFGDGFDVVPSPQDSRFGYAMYQGGNVYRYDVVTGKSVYIQPVHPEGKPLRFSWNAAIAQDPHNPTGVYFGSQMVHYSVDGGDSWKMLSPDLTTNDTAKQHQAESGGLTIDATKAENFTTIVSIAPSPIDKNVIWVGTDDGNLQLTKDGGKTWTNMIAGLKEAPAGAWIPQIEVSKHNAGEAYVVINNYRRNDWEPYVYKTTDFGAKWTRIASEADVSGHAHSIVQDPVAPKLLFLGTENGLYISVDAGTNWTKWDAGYPSVCTIDMKIHPREPDLIIGTFGRSAWVFDNILPFRELALKGTSLLDKSLVAFPVPDIIKAEIKGQSAPMFGADAQYKGRNKPTGANLRFWVNPNLFEEADETSETDDDSDKKKKKGGKKIKAYVLNNAMDTVRHLEWDVDTGLNNMYWWLGRDGVHWPSWSDPKPDAGKPRGASVLPGKYFIHYHYSGFKDSTTVTVLPDPRIEVNSAALEAKYAAVAELEKMITAETAAFNRLKTAKKTIGRINGQLGNAEKATKDTIQKQGKMLMDSIKLMQELFLTPKDFEGYDHVTIRLNNLLSTAFSFVRSSAGKMGENGEHAMRAARARLEEVLARVNALFDTQWPAYRSLVESATIPQFEDFEKIEVKE